MVSMLLIVVLIFDVILMGYVYFNSKKQARYGDVLEVFKEERMVLNEMRDSMREEAENYKLEIKSLCQKASAIATESELIYEKSKNDITNVSKDLNKEVGAHLDVSLKEINDKIRRLDKVVCSAEKKRQLLLKGVEKAEMLARFFDKNLPYEELLEEIEDKKFIDARSLLSKGFGPKDVAKQLNMPLSEVKLLLGLPL